MSAKITLISGVPGTGKTALCVKLILDYLKEKDPKKRRPIYVANDRDGKPCIPALDLPFETLEDLTRWHEPGMVPDGAIIIADEVQRLWRTRASGSALSPDLEALATHRHRGIDFILMTQRPGNLHTEVRGLVGRHIHLRNLGVLGRRMSEHTEFGDPAQAKKWLVQSRYKLPKEVFDLYKSAALHVDGKRTIPPALIIAGVGLVGLAGLVLYAVNSIGGRVSPAAPAVASAASAPRVVGPGNRQAGAQPPAAAASVPVRRTALSVSAAVPDREPYATHGVHLVGYYVQEGKKAATFSLSLDGRVLTHVTLAQLGRSGYAWRELGHCTGVLIFGERERPVYCDTPAPVRPQQGHQNRAGGPEQHFEGEGPPIAASPARAPI
ncbi:MAG: zonular occludens toxin domain-containing protein [Rubrivivax sp.]|nr:zonular occludens toxin domain-containing protein [Rubrivivax sp.]